MIDKRGADTGGFSGYTSQSLFSALAQYLKTPLMHVSYLDNQNLEQVKASAAAALEMINGFLAAGSQLDLALSPVMPSQLVYSVADELEELARSYDCKIETDFEGRQMPVMANPEALRTALVCLGQAFITAASAVEQKPVITLAINRTKEGTSTGVFANIEGLGSKALLRGRELHGKAKMPLAPAFSETGAGIFIADSLLSSMSAPLYAAKHNHSRGFAATLRLSKQLELV